MIFGAINSLIQSKKQKKMAKRINPVNATYQENPYIKDLFAEGQNLYQGRMVGAGQAEQNLLSNQANVLNQVNRNATSGSQALAAAAGIQGQTNQSFNDLALQEARDKQSRFGINSQVSQLMAREGDKVYEDKLRNYYDDLNYKRGLEGASMQNMAGFWGGLDNAAMAAVSLGTSGLLGGKSGGGAPAGVDTSPYTMTRPNYPRPNMERGPMPTPSNRPGYY